MPVPSGVTDAGFTRAMVSGIIRLLVPKWIKAATSHINAPDLAYDFMMTPPPAPIDLSPLHLTKNMLDFMHRFGLIIEP
jgi:hypothetical protein